MSESLCPRLPFTPKTLHDAIHVGVALSVHDESLRDGVTDCIYRVVEDYMQGRFFLAYYRSASMAGQVQASDRLSVNAAVTELAKSLGLVKP